MNARIVRSRLACAALVLAGSAVGASGALAFEDDWRDRDLETPLGYEDVAEMDRGMSGRRDELGRRIEITGPYGSTLASAIGNSIAVEAGPGATVVINAMQVNKGNQRATTEIDGETVQRMFQTEPAAGPRSSR